MKIVLLFVFFWFVHCQQNIGDLCTLQATGTEGVCKLIVDCPKAIQELQSSGKIPQNCGFQGTLPIVCCQKNQQFQPQQQNSQQPQSQHKQKREPGQISKKKCREYSKYTVEREKSPLLTGTGLIERNVCGHKVFNLIPGKVPASRREFPHMAVIGYQVTDLGITWRCGGAIISEKYILTAAHCLISPDSVPPMWVRTGIIDHILKTVHKQEIFISEYIAHPDYRPGSHYHDIGLIRLSEDIKLDSYSRPACLYTEHQINAQKSIATRWGKLDYARVTNSQLLKVVLDFFDHPSCNQSYRNEINSTLPQGILDESQVCAGSKTDEEKDTCLGDSGGPLQIYHISDDIKCMYDIVGVKSFPKECSGSPEVYTRVSHYIKWIEDIVWPESSSD